MKDEHSLIDNKGRGKVGEFLLNNIEPESELSIVSAYFTIYAYEHLSEKLDSIKSLRFLFGEPTFLQGLDPKQYHQKNFEIVENNDIKLQKKIEQKAISKQCAEWIRTKVEIKSMRKPNFLHGKLYYIQPPLRDPRTIIGSSNFTSNGLGFGKSPNIELNIVVGHNKDKNEIKNWFDEVWNDNTGLVEDVKEQVLEFLEQTYSENAPNFIYYKTLYHLFKNLIKDREAFDIQQFKTGLIDTKIWNTLYDFQKDGVRGAINKINKHRGCIIADSVGLGKTFEALAVIKHFELRNERVLVLCPKKLKENWTVYTLSDDRNTLLDDRFHYNVLCHTDLGRATGKQGDINLETFNWSNFGLVVIDESHNFKGNPTEKISTEGKIKQNRAKFLLDKIINSGVKTKVLMLSATPVNTHLKDLRNQIAIITGGDDSALKETTGINDITQTLKNAQTQFTNWAKNDNINKNQNDLLNKLHNDFIKLLDEITIARSRKQIIENYLNDKNLGNFPIKLRPISVYSKIDLTDRSYSYETINEKILNYTLSIFKPSSYLKNEAKEKYSVATKVEDKEAFTQVKREEILIGMMKMNYLKRLESSIESFEISIDRTIRKIEDFLLKFEQFETSKLKTKSIEIEELTDDIGDDDENMELLEMWQVGKKLKFDLSDLELEVWKKDLKKDKESLLDLYNFAHSVSPERDAKLFELKNIIKNKINNKINSNNSKILIFTTFADTAKYLYSTLEKWSKDEMGLNIAMVSGSETKTTYGKNEYFNILTNFSPLSKKRKSIKSMSQDEEIDLLIATDCISEGQNLQDCDFLINFDIHWNPIRIIQRFGRIDRIGSSNEKIQLLNFWPIEDLEKYMNLKKRVEERMILSNITSTGDDNILELNNMDNTNQENKYRLKQLEFLKNENLELEEIQEGFSLSDFSLEDFRIDLLNFVENNKEKLEKAPYGLYSVVASPMSVFANSVDSEKLTLSQKQIIKPGVIFCLKNKSNISENEKFNPLHPYYLVYIHNDEQVRFHYTNAKQILEFFKILCNNKKEYNKTLCDIFNKETNDGQNMKFYADLINAAITDIRKIIENKGNHALTSNNRDAKIQTNLNNKYSENDFQLITWLVIK